MPISFEDINKFYYKPFRMQETLMYHTIAYLAYLKQNQGDNSWTFIVGKTKSINEKESTLVADLNIKNLVMRMPNPIEKGKAIVNIAMIIQYDFKWTLTIISVPEKAGHISDFACDKDLT